METGQRGCHEVREVLLVHWQTQKLELGHMRHAQEILHQRGENNGISACIRPSLSEA